MKIIKSPKLIQQIIRKEKLKGKKIGFVPTMGALHQGHLSLIRAVRRQNNIVVVSIFVNPAQFGPKDDLKKYPRTIKKDIQFCKKAGVDLIFYPRAEQIYAHGFKTYVLVGGLSDLLCGKSRPGHFRGVTTVVAKLFNIITPDIAYFGQKDAQQAVIIKMMVRDLNFAVKIKVMPTVRESGGLALSSRNVYLNPKEKKEALVLYQCLRLGKKLIASGIKDAEKIIFAMKRLIKERKSVKIDYLSVVDSEDLKPLKKISGSCLIVLAVWIGKTRLIDNIIINNKNG